MVEVQVIPISARLCDLCNDGVTDEEHIATKSFILTDWGVICLECWDRRLVHREEFVVEMVYIKAWKIDDEWVRRPLVFIRLNERRG
jgi:hypothetical protein